MNTWAISSWDVVAMSVALQEYNRYVRPIYAAIDATRLPTVLVGLIGEYIIISAEDHFIGTIGVNGLIGKWTCDREWPPPFIQARLLVCDSGARLIIEEGMSVYRPADFKCARNIRMADVDRQFIADVLYGQIIRDLAWIRKAKQRPQAWHIAGELIANYISKARQLNMRLWYDEGAPAVSPYTCFGAA